MKQDNSKIKQDDSIEIIKNVIKNIKNLSDYNKDIAIEGLKKFAKKKQIENEINEMLKEILLIL